jgi:hypothetical protein
MTPTDRNPFADLSPNQLRATVEIRNQRRALEQRFDARTSALHDEHFKREDARSQQRHRYMVLAGGALALVVPLLGRAELPLSPGWVIAGAVLLVTHLTIGVVLDATYEVHRAPLVDAINEQVESHLLKILYEDISLAALVHETGASFDEQLAAAEARLIEADGHLSGVAARFSRGRALGTAAFFACFIVGLTALVVSMLVGLPMPEHPSAPQLRPGTPSSIGPTPQTGTSK